jgi:hypothetical protein
MLCACVSSKVCSGSGSGPETQTTRDYIGLAVRDWRGHGHVSAAQASQATSSSGSNKAAHKLKIHARTSFRTLEWEVEQEGVMPVPTGHTVV